MDAELLKRAQRKAAGLKAREPACCPLTCVDRRLFSDLLACVGLSGSRWYDHSFVVWFVLV